jgi:ribosomal protein uL24
MNEAAKLAKKDLSNNNGHKNKALSASLSPELSLEHKIHNMGIREGDTVAILRGNFRDVEGKVSKVDRQSGYVYVEGVTREKADGSTRQIPVHASKVTLRRLVLDDKRRKEIIDRRASTTQPEKKAETEKELEQKEEKKPRQRRRQHKQEIERQEQTQGEEKPKSRRRATRAEPEPETPGAEKKEGDV